MAGVVARVPMSHRIFTPYNNRENVFQGELALSMSDTVFGFLHEEGEGSPEIITYNKNEGQNDEEDEVEISGRIVEDNKKFWEDQHNLLQAALYRTSSLESKIRNCTKKALSEAQVSGDVCNCQNPVIGGCRSCLMKQVSGCLQNAGFNSAICKSKWKNLPDVPSAGEHTFVDILDTDTKKGEVRVIVELNFRGEFEMAKASEEYNKLVSKLPEVFIGKVERLLSLTTILGSAAKKCMKDKKMHLGPWRKTRYMQAKWLRVSERLTTVPRLMSTTVYSSRPQRPKASMLTVDLLEMLPNVQCSAVEVL